MTDHIDWNELLKKEDKLIANSDRKHRYHFKSLDRMSEELLYQESVLKHQEHERETTESEDFIETVKGEKLDNALRRLTPKQRKAVELAYWQGFKGREIAGDSQPISFSGGVVLPFQSLHWNEAKIRGYSGSSLESRTLEPSSPELGYLTRREAVRKGPEAEEQTRFRIPKRQPVLD